MIKAITKQKDYVAYKHHNKVVWVRRELKGKHRSHCLCFNCKLFKLNGEGNCPISFAVYENCVKYNIVSPVWECPDFEQNDDKVPDLDIGEPKISMA